MIGLRHWGDPYGLYKRPKEEQLEVLGMYYSERKRRRRASPPTHRGRRQVADGQGWEYASPDAKARADRFRVH